MARKTKYEFFAVIFGDDPDDHEPPDVIPLGSRSYVHDAEAEAEARYLSECREGVAIRIKRGDVRWSVRHHGAANIAADARAKRAREA